MPKHAPLISIFETGHFGLHKRGATVDRLVIAGGFVEVSADNVSVLADVAETAAEIDVDAARVERETTERALGAWSGSEADFEIEKERLELAQARLQLAGK